MPDAEVTSTNRIDCCARTDRAAASTRPATDAASRHSRLSDITPPLLQRLEPFELALRSLGVAFTLIGLAKLIMPVGFVGSELCGHLEVSNGLVHRPLRQQNLAEEVLRLRQLWLRREQCSQGIS